MVPTTTEVARWRAMMIGVLRLLSIVAALSALFPTSSWLLEGFRDSDLWDFSYYAPRVVPAFALIVAGLVLGFGSRRLAGVIVTFGKSGLCPKCSYPLESRARNCPECGIELSPEFTSDPDDKTTPAHKHSPETIHLVFTGLIRLGAALGCWTGITIAILLFVWMDEARFWTTSTAQYEVLLWVDLALILLCVWAMVRPRAWARWAVPGLGHTDDS